MKILHVVPTLKKDGAEVQLAELFKEINNVEIELFTFDLYENGDLTLVAQDHTHPKDQGYGRFYGDVTCYLGFNSYRESGKTMGLASFGNSERLSQYKPFDVNEFGEAISALRDVDYTKDNTSSSYNFLANSENQEQKIQLLELEYNTLLIML